jgi:hypothetical protein
MLTTEAFVNEKRNGVAHAQTNGQRRSFKIVEMPVAFSLSNAQ